MLAVGVAALVFPAAGQVSPLSGTPIVGAYTSADAAWGFLMPTGAGTTPGRGFGMAFDALSDVWSLDIGQGIVGAGYARNYVKQFDVWADGALVGYVPLADLERNQTNLPIYSYETNAPMTVKGVTWMTFVCTEIYKAGWDAGGLLQSFSVNGAPVAGADPVRPNLNLGQSYTSSHTSGGGVTYYDGKTVTDGILTHLGSAYSPLWNRGGLGSDPVSVTVSYGDERCDVGSVGIAFAAHEGNRGAPRWVWISSDRHAEYTDGVKIDISDVLTYYNRYDLLEYIENEKDMKYFQGISELTITFPKADDAAAWYTTQSFFGLTEFQAFAPVVPEPATMTLLALGGLALLRRGRR